MSQFETFFKFSFNFLFIFFMGTASQAQNSAETVEDAKQALEDLKANVNGLKYFAERIDLGRIMVLERRIDATHASVASKGLGNWETMKSYQELVLAFRYSEQFMESISTEMSSGYIAEIKKMNDAMIKSRGFDKNVTGSLVANILKQIKNLADQIQSGRDLDSNLEAWFRKDFNTAIGNALAAAQTHGDVPSSYFRANDIYKMVASQYDRLYKINTKNPAYNMVTELMGLLEFYQAMATSGLNAAQISNPAGQAPTKSELGME